MNYYGDDSSVRKVQNGASRRVYYVYSHEEAIEKFSAILNDVPWIIHEIKQYLGLKVSLSFVIAESQSPYEVLGMDDEQYVIVISQRAYYYLLTICLTLQSVNPLHEFIGIKEIPLSKDYRGWFALDITKDIVFQTRDVSHLTVHPIPMNVFLSALTFIIGHEIAHVAHGHLDLQRCDAYRQFVSTLDDRNLTYRALEMDADSSATSTVFSVFESISERASEKEGIARGSKEFANTKQIIRNQYCCGIVICLLYLDTLASNYFPVMHPVSYARFITAKGVMEIMFNRHAPEAKDTFKDARKKIADMFERLIGGECDPGHPFISNSMVWTSDVANVTYEYDENFIPEIEYERHVAPLHGRWARLRPFLEEHVKGGQLASATSEPY